MSYKIKEKGFKIMEINKFENLFPKNWVFSTSFHTSLIFCQNKFAMLATH